MLRLLCWEEWMEGSTARRKALTESEKTTSCLRSGGASKRAALMPSSMAMSSASSLLNYPAKRCTLWSNLFFEELLEQLIRQSSYELLAICVRVWPMDHTRRMSLQLL